MRNVTHQGVVYSVSEAHPAAEAMPWATDDEEFAGLISSMKQDGFDPNTPVTRILITGLLADGRRRELAATIAGVTPVYRDVSWTDEEVVSFVERDLSRRNITPSQRSAVAIELASLHNRGGDRKHLENKEQIKGSREPLIPKTSSQIATEIGVGKSTVDAVAKVKKKAPELLQFVKDDVLPARIAAQVADLTGKQRDAIVKAENPLKAARKILAEKREKEKRLKVAAGSTGETPTPSGGEPVVDGGGKPPEPPKSGKAEETPAGGDKPPDEPGEPIEHDPENPPLDPRFMPHAGEAPGYADKFRNWCARLRILRNEIRRAFQDRDSVMGMRINVDSMTAHFDEFAETLDGNIPEYVCPPCCGTGKESGIKCKFCDGFGIVDKHHHGGLKARWKVTAARLAELKNHAEVA